MSRYFSSKYASLVPYVPGEQPREMQFIKLNTNESPYPPSPKAIRMASDIADSLQLYSDPECKPLVQELAKLYNLSENEIIFSNGSDEILNFAFMAFCDQNTPAVFPDITYGFYPVFADVNGIPYEEIPLKEDFSIEIEKYFHAGKTIFIANPNAPTGLALPRSDIEKILQNNPDNVVVIDEAYVDFGGESCVPLIHTYENLLVIQTFSKSRSMAGARLGFGVGNSDLIQDLSAIRYSVNPYNINRMTMAAGVGALMDEEYTWNNCRAIIETRDYTIKCLREMGFIVADSATNFMFPRHPEISGEDLYKKLRQRGILVRHFSKERIREYNRITIGTREQMDIFLEAVREILQEIQSGN